MRRYVATSFNLLRAVSIVLLTAGHASSAAAQDDTHARVAHAAERYLTEHYPNDASRFEVRVVRTSGTLPASASLRVTFPPASALPRAHAQVLILSADDGGALREVGHAMLYIAHFDSLIVARSRVAQDGVISGNDVSVAWMETTRMHGTPLRADDFRQMLSSGPVHARRLIREGQALRSTDVRAAYAAEAGGPVLMTYDRGPITLKLSCSAREPGALGEVIRVYSSDTSTMYKARLTGPGHAVWIETL